MSTLDLGPGVHEIHECSHKCSLAFPRTAPGPAKGMCWGTQDLDPIGPLLTVAHRAREAATLDEVIASARLYYTCKGKRQIPIAARRRTRSWVEGADALTRSNKRYFHNIPAHYNRVVAQRVEVLGGVERGVMLR